MILNLAGVAFAITAIVSYSIMIGDLWMGSMCDDDYGYRYRYRYDDDYGYQRPTPSPEEKRMKEKCLEGREMTLVRVENVISAVKIQVVRVMSEK